jgi:hypothetical protein
MRQCTKARRKEGKERKEARSMKTTEGEQAATAEEEGGLINERKMEDERLRYGTQDR